MSKSKEKRPQRNSRLTPVVSLLMYETLLWIDTMISERTVNGLVMFDVDELKTKVSDLLTKIRGEDISDTREDGLTMARTAVASGQQAETKKKKKEEELEVLDPKESYTVRMACKTPSSKVQFRMLEADVSVSGSDPDELVDIAAKRLAQAIANLCVSWGEVPPDDIKDTLLSVYEEEDVNLLYEE